MTESDKIQDVARRCFVEGLVAGWLSFAVMGCIYLIVSSLRG